MIEFTIKTLDSKNHKFSVEDETTVQQLKDKVREQMGIDIHLQRLIFCGRVLQDEKRLSDYDVHGKVMHLVQRAPPSPESRHATSSANTSSSNAEGNNAIPQPTRRPNPLASIIREEQASPTNGRLEFIRLMISEIKLSLARLQARPGNGSNAEDSTAAPASGEANVENMETDPIPSATQEEGDATLEQPAEAPADSVARAQQARRRSYRAVRALRPRYSRPRDLGYLLEELAALEDQFALHRGRYTRLLITGDTGQPSYNEEDRQAAQRTVDIVTDIMHSFAHAYHAVSDINFQVGQRNPRLTSEASVMRHPLPMQQAHINVVQSHRRQGQNATAPTNVATGAATPQTATATTATATSSTVTATATSAPVPTATATATATTTGTGSQLDAQQTENQSHQAGRNTTQPTVNINIQPDPITYQVEIETRVPIAFALENALLNGLTSAGPNGSNANAGAGANPTPAPQDGQPNQQNQPNQPQARRQVLFDFENLFRGLGQTGGLGGVEVVMSMEEIPNGGIVGHVPASQAGPAAPQAPPTLQALGSVQQTDGGGNAPLIFGADIYLGPMPWGGAPSADLLQNIVSSVIRQGLLPGGEAVALQVAHALPTRNNPPQPGADQPAANNGHNNGGRHANVHVRRATTTTRAHPGTLNNFIYDRFLLCGSPHARRRLLRRWEQQQQQAAANARARADRAAAQNIEVLRERNPNFTQNNIQTMVDLLTCEPTPATFTNAFLLAVARHLFLTEPMQMATGEPAPVPNEFLSLRQMLRVYLQGLLARSGGVRSERTFDTVAEFLLEEHNHFLCQVDNIVPLHLDVNFIASIRGLIAARLPAIIASVMSDSTTESFVAHFYATFSHLFTDVCALMAYCCRDGVEGLRTLFRAFLEEKVRELGCEDVQQALMTLGMENLGVVINSLNVIQEVDPIQQYIVRRAPDLPDAESQEPSPMEVSPQGSESSSDAPTEPAQPTESVDPPAPASAEAAAAPVAAPAPVPAPAPAAVPAPTSASDVTSTTSEEGACALPPPTNEASPVPEPQASRSTPTQSARANRPERETGSQRTSPDSSNLGFVPPMMLLQHWGEEWVPVFTRDQQRVDVPQEPYSDAYLSGMPSRKRRRVRQTRPHNLDSFINESVREASERPAPVDSDAVRRAFREHMRGMARSRAAGSEDYDPLRYASAARFLNSPDTKTEPTKTSEDEA